MLTRSERPKMISQSTVIRMGWTKSMIDKLLSEPTLAPNPHYKNASPMKLYNEEEVLDMMLTEEYEMEYEKASKRKKAAQRAVVTKKKNLSEELKQYAESVTVTILDEQELIRRTIQAKKEWYEYNWKDFCEFDIDDYTLNRWVVNYIRHNLVQYSQGLRALVGKTGREEVYKEYRNLILEKIAEAYPDYKEECEDQKIYF